MPGIRHDVGVMPKVDFGLEFGEEAVTENGVSEEIVFLKLDPVVKPRDDGRME